MELKPIKRVTIPEKLIRCESGGPKPHAAGRNIKDIAVPMCGDKPGGHPSPQRIVTRNRIQRDLKKADFGVTRLHACSQRQSHELSSQAQAQDRFSESCGVADERAFARKIRVLVLLVGALRTSAQDQASKAIECFRDWLAEIRPEDGKRNADFIERFAKETRSVKIAVLYEQDLLVPHNVPARTSKHNRTGGTGGHFPRVIRIGMPRFTPLAKTPRLNSAQKSCDGIIAKNSAPRAYCRQ